MAEIDHAANGARSIEGFEGWLRPEILGERFVDEWKRDYEERREEFARPGYWSPYVHERYKRPLWRADLEFEIKRAREWSSFFEGGARKLGHTVLARQYGDCYQLDSEYAFFDEAGTHVSTARTYGEACGWLTHHFQAAKLDALVKDAPSRRRRPGL